MNTTNKQSPGARGIPQPFNRQAVPTPQIKAAVAQSRNGLSAQSVKQPVAPPAYRPQATPKAAQPKMAHDAVSRKPPVAPPVYHPGAKTLVQPKAILQPRNSPTAPPSYRLEQKRIAQPKMASTAQVHMRPKAPPVYRPQAKPVSVQPKMTGSALMKKHSLAPPVYHPQPVPRVLQTKKTIPRDGERQPVDKSLPSPNPGVAQLTSFSGAEKSESKTRIHKAAMLQARAVIQCGQGSSSESKAGSGGGKKTPPRKNSGGGGGKKSPPRKNSGNFNFQETAESDKQEVMAPAVRTLQRLFPLEPITYGEDGASQKQDFNYSVGELLKTGKKFGVNEEPLSEMEEAAATQWILGRMDSGGGEYGPSCKKKVPEVVKLANQFGYHIDQDEVRHLLVYIVIHLSGIGGSTTIGGFKGDWHGGGFFDYSKMNK